MAPIQLTKREVQVRRLVVDGLTNDAIATELGISSRTVEAHLRMLFRKTGASRRDQLSSPSPAAPPVQLPGEGDTIRRLEGVLAERERQVRSYDAAVQRMIDRQFPLFDERVEITVTVGSHAGEDMVVERHWTIPKPYLVYRIVRPITAADLPLQTALDSLAPACDVVSADVGVAVEVVADPNGRPQAAIFFQPGLEQPTEWILRYRTPGLWDPLRDRGEDRLTWAAGTLDGRHPDSLGDLRMHFAFPPDAASVDVSELHGTGRIEWPGKNHVVYVDDTRTGGVYDWRLRMRLHQLAGVNGPERRKDGSHSRPSSGRRDPPDR